MGQWELVIVASAAWPWIPSKITLVNYVHSPGTPSSATILAIILTPLAPSSRAAVLLMDNFAAVEKADNADASEKAKHFKCWGTTTSASASSMAQSRRTSFTRVTKWPMASTKFLTRPPFSSCASI
eukprot:4110512-Pleurochrysis_carterae.AAC.3